MRKVSKNTRETAQIAKEFFDKILKNTKRGSGALVVGLSGNLGAGKTAFTQALAKHLGVKAKVNSPTFVIMKRYPVKHKDYKNLYHFDAYRLGDEKELLHLTWDEIILNKENIVILEWPEQVSKAMPVHTHTISINIGKDNERIFELK